jgi:hypothetical protein
MWKYYLFLFYFSHFWSYIFSNLISFVEYELFLYSQKLAKIGQQIYWNRIVTRRVMRVERTTMKKAIGERKLTKTN